MVEPRYEELFNLVHAELKRSGFEEMVAAGMVLTGGGSKMEGAIDLAEEVFHMPVRLGSPQFISGLVDVVRNPIFATGVGLLLFGNHAGDSSAQHNRFDSAGGILDRMKNWIHRNF